MNILLIKVIMMPLVIGLITVLSRKWGNKTGGLIASMPWIAGPILLFFILEQGKAFGIRSIPGIFTGVVSLLCFIYCYARLSRRFNGVTTLLISYVVYVGVAMIVSFDRLNLFVSYGITMSCIGLVLTLFPVPSQQQVLTKRLPYDIVIRMVVATLFVVLITQIAALLGPNWSGILTPFPIITSILAIFTHYLQGSSAAIITLRSTVVGMFGFTTFLFLQSLLLPIVSVGTSFVIGLIINGFINFSFYKLSSRTR